MEGQKPELGPRNLSAFNPEAANFRPTQAAGITPVTESVQSTTAAPSTMPQGHLRMPMAPTHGAPVTSASNAGSAYERGAAMAHVPSGLGDPRARDVPFDDLQRMLQEHHIDHEHGTTGVPLRGYAMNRPATRHPPSRFQPSFQTNRIPASLDELSASFRLRNVENDLMIDESGPYEGGRDPLFAQYVDTSRRGSSDRSAASRGHQQPLMGLGAPGVMAADTTRVVQPPPGFLGLDARVPAEDHMSVPSTVMEHGYVPSGPSVITEPRHVPTGPAAFRSPPRLRPRRPSRPMRPKRTDQGPEPSAADIYPEDAIWDPSQQPYVGKGKEPMRDPVYQHPLLFVPESSPQQELVVTDTASWPTPAEMYAGPGPAAVRAQNPDPRPQALGDVVYGQSQQSYVGKGKEPMKEPMHSPPSSVPHSSPEQELLVTDTASWPTPAEMYLGSAPAAAHPSRSNMPLPAPGDVVWGLSQEPYVGKGKEPLKEPMHSPPTLVPHSSPQEEELVVTDTASWPTPAEVYLGPGRGPAAVRPRAPYPPPREPEFNIFENHVAPTAEDMNDADAEVEALMNQIPHLTVNRLLTYGAPILLCDPRPLTPGQLDGSRYSLRIGRSWDPIYPGEGTPFRIRPRNHEGWGGWEWALKNGWGQQ
ncbi:hypothetical protein N0V83_001493 [Neocucurbitaria cava]|uniref:Uncharacterized protein n=1 Tax=Neocucurbitaria cava TaxID=798079 RepID=A0A9W8YF02_9PLEO|nr:hypothetical protein N0V83_001493 [Neocucurbitaria cava]